MKALEKRIAWALSSVEPEDKNSDYRSREEQEANARAIAALPELLDVCKILVKSLRILQASSFLLKEVELNSVKAADALIDKIEGRG